MPVNPTSPLYSLVSTDQAYTAKSHAQSAQNRKNIVSWFSHAYDAAAHGFKVANGIDDGEPFEGDPHVDPQGFIDTVTESSADEATPSSGSGSGSGSPIIYSDWSGAAKQFGMDQATAYQEHLANTAHQREVADLKAAGLNPVLGISGTGSSVFSGSVAGSSYGGSGKALGTSGIGAVLGSIAGIAAMAFTKSPWKAASIGSATSKAVSGVVDLIEKSLRK